MESISADEVADPPVSKSGQTVYAVLFAISFSHLLNDTIQALIPSLYPLIKSSLGLNFTQLGLITFTFQCTASLLQPLVGLLTDRRPMPYSLSAGMGLTLIGLLLLSEAHSFPMMIISAALVGMGSAIFHPEASRIAHMAAGRQRGLAQSLFQVGGNAGSSLGPLLAALIIVPRGQGHVAWFSLAACLGMFVLWHVGSWQLKNLDRIQRRGTKSASARAAALPRRTVTLSLLVLVALTFSKYVYLVSITSYYTFYLMEHFKVSVQSSQLYLFIFLFAVAAGTIIGGPVGDRIGRKRVIWVSILGVAPFSLWLPHANLATTAVLSVFIGLILASAFSAILVYAQELMPGKVGLVAGLFFGLAFGIAGIGSAVLGKVADHIGIIAVFHFCAYLPLIGLLTVFLPDLETAHRAAK
ncbi:MAG: major facilitator superfamily 1 [Chthoniobacteraceae bacterium]|nr:major facilitator superfamily 1 [Chthoniobacteraceae bacterium]